MSASRSGKTLIEVAVILALTSVVMSAATATLIALFRVDRQLRSQAAADVNVARLASHWRQDVHAALAAKVDGECQLTLFDGKTVHYRFAAPAIHREVRRGQEVEHRDAFVLPRNAQVAFSRGATTEESTLHLAIISAASSAQTRGVPVQPLTFLVALNLHGQPTAQEAAP